MDNTTNQSVAQTILQQLGGNKFIVMTGAKNLSTSGNNLSFKLGRNPKGFTHCKIELTSLDLYDMTFYKVRKCQITKQYDWTMVYADKLRYIFEQQTGLATSLEVRYA